MSKQHHYDSRVYYEDTDALGIVYHANYLKFAERARTEWLRSVDYDHTIMLQEEKAAFVVYRLEIDYHAPARLDDLITVETKIVELSRATLTMEQTLLVKGHKKASVKVMLACVTPDGKPVRWPPKLFSLLS